MTSPPLTPLPVRPPDLHDIAIKDGEAAILWFDQALASTSGPPA